MHDFLRLVSRSQLSAPWRFGIAVAAVALVSLLRWVAPLNTAPYLLYLPIIIGVAITVGWRPAAIGVILSDLLAAYFFLHDSHRSTLSAGQAIAVAEYLVVAAGMVAICAAFRRAVVDNERAFAALNASQTALQAAKDEADAARTAAEDANKAKSTFLANMSHELRTPLSAVIGYSEMLEEEVEELGQASMLADLGKIKSNAKHLLSLINDVLDLSKVEANKMELYVEALDVDAFVREAAGTVESLVARRGNRLVLAVPDDAGVMRTDIVKLRQCLFNLLSNAAKFTENGRITVTVERRAVAGTDWISFEVADTGIGMTPAQIGRLFQRFSQADETTTRQFGGTGLGLALSRAFAQLMGGDIEVASVAGEGTRFTLRVPGAPPDASGEAAGLDEAPADRDLVLIIDDEASQRELMTRFLERRGYAVRSASNGREGLALAGAIAPRVILLDVMMPEMDGWTVLGSLKQDPVTAAIPVVMVSFVADAAIGEAMGATATLPKPVDWAHLDATLAQLRGIGGQVLVVDDDADMRARLRTAFERSGWSVREAENGAEALTLLDPAPDLIVLDLTMPVMDGFAFLHSLRALPSGADIHVVVLSARDITFAERQELTSADRIFRKGDTDLSSIAAELSSLRK